MGVCNGDFTGKEAEKKLRSREVRAYLPVHQSVHNGTHGMAIPDLLWSDPLECFLTPLPPPSTISSISKSCGLHHPIMQEPPALHTSSRPLQSKLPSFLHRSFQKAFCFCTHLSMASRRILFKVCQTMLFLCSNSPMAFHFTWNRSQSPYGL